MLGVVWTVVFVLVGIELTQPEEPHPDSIDHQSRVDHEARSKPGLYSVRKGRNLLEARGVPVFFSSYQGRGEMWEMV